MQCNQNLLNIPISVYYWSLLIFQHYFTFTSHVSITLATVAAGQTLELLHLSYEI